jgi:hypothetical protein
VKDRHELSLIEPAPPSLAPLPIEHAFDHSPERSNSHNLCVSPQKR